MFKCLDRLIESVKVEYSVNPVATLFALAMSVLLLVFVVASLLSQGETVYYMFWKEHDRTFMDFFDSIVYSSDSPYTHWKVIYPPLITTLYDLLGHLTIPLVNPDGAYLGYALRESQMGLMTYLAITAVSIYLIILFMRKVLKAEGRIKEILIVLLIASYPFIYAIERGNIIIATLFFCLVFVFGYNSKNKKIRYLSYLSLAIATGFKIYPLLLVILIARESRYKEAAVCFATGICALFLPFLLTDGGPIIMLENIVNYVVIEAPSGFININQFMLTTMGSFLPNHTIDIIGYAIVAIMYAVTFAIVMTDREIEFWKLIALICCCMILGPGVGTPYLFIYLLIPLILFLNEEGTMSTSKVFYLFCFVMIFALLPGFASRWEDIALTIIFSIKAMFVMLLMGGIIVDRVLSLKNRRQAKESESAEQEIIKAN
jgi:hypothetical protein